MLPLAIKIDTEMLHLALSSVGFGILGMVLLLLGHKVFHTMDLGRKLSRAHFKEQIQSGNIAAALYVGLVEAAFIVGLAYIIGKVVSA